jgi:hypothetical protein
MLYATFLIGFACFAFELLLWLFSGHGLPNLPPASGSFTMLSVLVMASSAGFIEVKGALKNRPDREQR